MFIDNQSSNKVTAPNHGLSLQDTTMNILILGSGNMGSALAQQASRAGHDVRIAATTLAKAQSVASAFPGVTAVEAAGSTATADVVIVATPYAKAVAPLAAACPHARKGLIRTRHPATPHQPDPNG